MVSLRPVARFETHEVFNQPPPLEDINLFTSDRALSEAVARAGGAEHTARLTAMGARAGSQQAQDWGREANRVLPVLETHDRFGQRIDEVTFHPAYHQLMDLGLSSGIASLAWQDGVGAGHVAHSALMLLLTQADAGTSCPMTMTYAAVPALRAEPSVAAEWVPRITAGAYDPACRPAADKAGVTIG